MKRPKTRVGKLPVWFVLEMYQEEGIAIECEDGRFGVVVWENSKEKTA